LMAELEGRGLITRRPSANDRRAQVITLTPAGTKFTVKLLDLHRRLEDDLAKALGARERDQLLLLLKRFRKLATQPKLDDDAD
jgi:DNA-binding MarR family transcriptional regulator